MTLISQPRVICIFLLNLIDIHDFAWHFDFKNTSSFCHFIFAFNFTIYFGFVYLILQKFCILQIIFISFNWFMTNYLCIYFIYFIYIYIYAFSRRIYPKRLIIAFRLYIMCSLGIEPTTFCAADAMLYHWATQEHLFLFIFFNVSFWMVTLTLWVWW